MFIGIPVSESKTQFFINQAYIEYIKGAGYNPFLITSCTDVKAAAHVCSGLVLPGGIDLDPIYYGYDNFTSIGVDPEKDAFERKLLYEFKAAGKPIFGICRGLQLIAREYMISRDVDNRLVFVSHLDKHNQVNNQDLSRTVMSHFVEFFPSLYGKSGKKISAMAVNSMHHQGVMIKMWERAGKLRTKLNPDVCGFEMLAWTERAMDSKDKTDYVLCEAFFISDWGAPVLAVQWHPEELMDVDLVKNFFDFYTKSKKLIGENNDTLFKDGSS